MSVLCQVYYGAPVDSLREEKLSAEVARFGGKLTAKDEPDPPCAAVILYFEFDDWHSAEDAAKFLYERGEHVEGPMTYGD
jgi:hypothetical protein